MIPMKRTLFLIISFLALLSAANSCRWNSNSSNTPKPQNSIDGTYYWSAFQASHTVTITGNHWSGTSVWYDNVSYESGTIEGNTIYDSTGMIAIGRIFGNSISWGNHTLRKE